MAVQVPSRKIQRLIDEGLFDQLPPTFTSFFFQKIREWELLFPAEQGYFERLFGLLDRAPDEAVERLFARLRQIERKMGVNPETWDPKEFTLDHVDFLNRSPYYSEWRGEIREIFSRIDPMLEEEVQRTGRRRLVMVFSPPELPTGVDRMWTRLREHGKAVPLRVEDPKDLLPQFLTGAGREKAAPSLLEWYQRRESKGNWDAWAVESRTSLEPFAGGGAVRLSYDALGGHRDRLMAKVRELLSKGTIYGPRELGARLKQINAPSGSDQIDGSPVLSEFLRAVMLSGNGTLLLNNTFVEWAAVQAARRARPHVTAVSFGIRNKIKPFSSLLMYRDQEKVNIIPRQMDVLGTYVDLEVFYLYIWRGFEKYAEYRNKTAYLFLGEYLDQMFVIAPDEFPAMKASGPLSPARLHADCKEWLAA